MVGEAVKDVVGNRAIYRAVPLAGSVDIKCKPHLGDINRHRGKPNGEVCQNTVHGSGRVRAVSTLCSAQH